MGEIMQNTTHSVLLLAVAALALASALPTTTYCYHREDAKDHKCYEGCATKDFKNSLLQHPGQCNPDVFKVTESTKTITACSDGKTNLKYCSGTLYPVNITMRVKGEAAVQMMAPEAGITCGNASAVVASIHMYSHATEEAKL